MTVIAVTGLRAEARLAAQAGLVAVCAGGQPERTTAALAAALDGAGGSKVRGLISFGIAGGLAPGLASGTLVVGCAVIAGDARFAADTRWARAVHDCTGGAEGDIIGADAIIATAVEKCALYGRTAALAVDLESLVVARAAARAAIPFIVLRAVADPAWRNLPAAALLPLTADGRPKLLRVLGSLAARPGQLGGLLRAASETRRALRALRRGLAAAGPALRPPSPKP